MAARQVADVARDETYWREIQQAFTLDRTIINLNNGGCCPSPRVVHEALKRYLDLSNQAPVYHMWQILEPNIEARAPDAGRRRRRRSGDHRDHAQRQRGAADRATGPRPQAWRRSPHDQSGLRPDAANLGPARRARRDQADEDLVSRCRRRQADLVKRFEAAITPATKVLHFCHITNLTGPHLPGQGAVRARAPARHHDDRRRRARLRALSVQDSGLRLRLLRHEPAQVAARADRHGLSLRAPGAHCVAPGRFNPRPRRWPRTSASSRRSARIRRRITTPSPRRSCFITASAPSGKRRGCATSRSAGRGASSRSRASQIHTSLDPALSCAIGTVGIDGIPPGTITAKLWEKWRIIATPIAHAEYQGIRVTPNVYTTLEEIDTFADAMEAIGKT